MTVPATNQQEVEIQQETTRNALLVVSVIAGVLILLTVVSWFLFDMTEQALQPLVPITAVAVVFVGVLLIRQGRIIPGIILSLVALGVAYIFFITQFSGVGVLAAIVFTLVVASAAFETFPPGYLARMLTFAIIAGLLLLVLDLFWPGPQRSALPSELRPLVLLAIGAGLILVIYTLRRYPDFRLREKLITAFVGVSLLPLIVLVTVTNNVTRNTLIEDANLRLQAAARQTAVAVDDFMANSLQTIRTEANLLEETGYMNLDPAAREGSPIEAAALAQLKTFRDKNPLNISSYALLAPDGEVLLEYPLNAPVVDERERDYLLAPLENAAPFASEVQFTPIAGYPFLYFSAPVLDESGDVAAVLRARYKANILQELIARSTGLVGGQSFAVLFDENHLHLAHGTAPKAVYKLITSLDPEEIADLQAVERLPNLPPSDLSVDVPGLAERLDQATSEPFFTAVDVTSGDRLNQVAVTATSNQPWQVAFFQPQDVFLEAVQSQTRTAIILAVVVTGAVIAVAVALAAFLTGPIIRLEQAAERVAQGDLNVRAHVEATDEIGSLAATFNLMTSRLQETLLGLEQRVVDRTRALSTSIEVGRRLSTILDRQDLVTEVVEQVRQAFGYYHAHIYLFDETSQDLLLVGGTGSVGQILLDRGHKLPKGKGLVGRAATQNSVVLVPDVTEDPDWLPNPLLPETKSEVAVPIAVGTTVLGVLDVQDNEVNSLQQEDADLLLSVANQVAIALSNAEAYTEIQRQAERRALINEINRKIQNSFDAEKAMQIAVRELGRAVGGRPTRVWINAPRDASNGDGVSLEE